MLPRLRAANTVPMDQTIRYPQVSGGSRYTFSIWAFPEDHYGDTLLDVLQVGEGLLPARPASGPNMLHVGYRIMQDDSSLFSYTFHSNVLTIDPVSTGAPGWKEFLEEYNEFCSDHDGKPLLQPVLGPDARAGAQGVRRPDRPVRGATGSATTRTTGF